MTESVLNIEPNEFIIKEQKEETIYNFLDFLKNSYNIDINKYYDILNSIDEFKIKNIYTYLYLRIQKISRMSNNYITNLKKIDGRVSGEELNNGLNEYIKSKKLQAIIIMNGIQSYFYPNISLS
tara:strand:+ start:122 stop:493 length:372 start_codon:yes stop_codon:yes gene_type:complete